MIEVALRQERSCSGYEALAGDGSEGSGSPVQHELASKGWRDEKKATSGETVAFWGLGSGEAGGLATVEGKRSLA